MPGSIIQTIGTAEFEDALGTENQSKAGNRFQRVRTKPEIKSIIVLRGRTDQVPQGV